MTNRQWATNSIHLFCGPKLLSQARSDIATSGGSLFELSLEGIRSEDDLTQRYIETFRIPWRIVGEDSVVSVASELYWIEGPREFLVITSGSGHMQTQIAEEFISVMVRIVDRMREAGDQYTIMFPTSSSSDLLLTGLQSENCRIAAPPNYPWIRQSQPIPVIDHRGDTPPAS